MSALASTDWNAKSSATAAEMPFPANCEEESMRTRLTAIRDTIIVLALQVVFRTTQALRSWNY
jgi:hypothetical protein